MNTFNRISGFVTGRRGRWVTLLVWLVLAVVLTLALPGAGDEEVNNAPNMDSSKPSLQAAAIEAREFPNESGLPALLVLHREGGISSADLAKVQQLAADWEANPLPHQSAVPPLHKLPLPALNEQLSADGSTIIMPVTFEANADTEQLEKSLDQLREDVTAAFGGEPFETAADQPASLSARVTGPVGIQVDATGLFKNADVSLLMATVLIVLVILLLIYRSPVLAFIPLIAVGFAYMVVGPILGAMAHEGWITIDSQGISIMTVLLFGAGTDYCLFLISQFRDRLSSEKEKRSALLQAMTGSSGAIAMSGLTVVLSLLALLFAQYGAYHRFAIPFSLSIFIMAIASLTLVPALLAIFGRASFYPFVPRTPDMIAERAQRKGKPAPTPKPVSKEGLVGRLVVRRPWTVVLSTTIVLAVLAGFSSQLKVSFDILSSFPKDMESREGFAIIGEEFTEGSLAPVRVIVDADGNDAEPIRQHLSALPYVSSVSKLEQGSVNPNIYAMDVSLSMNPYSQEAMDLIPKLRDETMAALAAAGNGGLTAERVWIGGQTAEQYDTKATGDRDTRVIIPIVIGLITLLLLGYLRSIVATAYLIGTVILSYFAALGLGWIIIHYALGADAISGSIPLYSFVFLVALGEDYNIFMISSIWDKRKRMPLSRAISEGVKETGSVITSAGIILAGTFAVLASLPIQVLVHFGIVTAVGVLLDTFIVRPFLVPAITALLGRAAFWPGKHVPVEDSGSREVGRTESH
ncbi:MMPL family transporter [Paenibacillus kobensis]|uniref:MMPL family transporter n=1 Tax=Paenibacillus kobensis TaxID=59841 RepID=UPI000FDC685E|nr:MMPL family transporter [Paenibacillus kobensis]